MDDVQPIPVSTSVLLLIGFFRCPPSVILPGSRQRVVCCLSADDGLKQVAVQRPDVVIISANIADYSVYEMCEKVRRQSGGDNAVVLLSASESEDIDELRAYAAGADNVVRRGAAASALADMVKNSLVLKSRQTKMERLLTLSRQKYLSVLQENNLQQPMLNFLLACAQETCFADLYEELSKVLSDCNVDFCIRFGGSSGQWFCNTTEISPCERARLDQPFRRDIWLTSEACIWFGTAFRLLVRNFPTDESDKTSKLFMLISLLVKTLDDRLSRLTDTTNLQGFVAEMPGRMALLQQDFFTLNRAFERMESRAYGLLTDSDVEKPQDQLTAANEVRALAGYVKREMQRLRGHIIDNMR